MENRVSKKSRKTNETNIYISCNLDGTGKYNVNTGVRFFDHMLEQLSRHSKIDLEVNIEGDIDIDDHHTVEDAGIVLGEVLREALGDKRGINRYAFAITPMDGVLVETAIDICDRPYFVFDVDFTRGNVGGLSTEMVEHFFYSMAIGMRATLHINRKYGSNTHHLIEGIFKSVAVTLKNAVYQDARNKGALPTTKGRI